MYLPETYGGAILMMFITMVCWGSWANMTKIDKNWRFELFYWDYAIGVFLMSLIFGITLGSFGGTGMGFFPNMIHASMSVVLKALFSGMIFNIANILLVGAITIAGMAVAFPIGIGIALVVGTLLSYFVHPVGNVFVLFIGVLLILLAVILDGIAYKKAGTSTHASGKGITIAIISGVLMSLFYPLIAESMLERRGLNPYSAVFFFSVGLLLSNLVINSLFMKKPITGGQLTVHDYFRGTKLQHAYGIIGGLIWCIGMTFNVIASTRAGPAIAYSFGQGATLIAAIWGVFIWREFKNGKNVSSLLLFMFVAYILGLLAIGISKVS